MQELFDRAKSTISEHISNVFAEGELIENQVVRKFRTTADDGKEHFAAFTEQTLNTITRICNTCPQL